MSAPDLTSNSKLSSEDSYWLQQWGNGVAAFIALSSICIALKITATIFQLRRDDTPKRNALITSMALAVAGWVAFLPMCVLSIIYCKATEVYYSKIGFNIELHQNVLMTKMEYGVSSLYPIAAALPKLSICFLYLRLFDVNVWARRTTKILIALLIANAIAWFIPSAAVCYPLSSLFSPSEPAQHCLNRSVLGTWISVPQIAADSIILVLPVLMIWKRQMSTAKKLGAVFVLVTGSFGLFSACIRLGLYIHDDYNTDGLVLSLKITSLDNMFFIFEPGTYLIAACLPTLPIVFAKAHAALNPWKIGLYALVSRYIHRYRHDPGYDHTREVNDEGKPSPKLNIKLTGAGNLETLARESKTIGIAATGAV